MKTENNRPRKVVQNEILTLEELNKQINERVDRIRDEFVEGFNFVKKCSTSVTVFGSARTLPKEHDYKVAQELGYRIAKELGYAVITGGGPGIMEAANRGAHEGGGKSLGLTIKLPMEQTTNPYLTDHLDFQYFFSRKVSMSFSAETYVYFPGGYGTLDELFEILTLVQTEKIEPTPIILMGKKYWKPLDKFIKKTLLNGDFPKIDKIDLNLYTITDSIDEAMEIIKNAPVRIGNE
jgi:hypothetical protein